MKYIKYKLKWEGNDGYDPSHVLGSKNFVNISYDLDKTEQEKFYFGVILNDSSLNDLLDFEAQESSIEEILFSAKKIDPNCYVLEDGLIYFNKPNF